MDHIVVGVDGSESAKAALRWAVDEGSLHGATVVALLAWNYLDQPDRAGDNDFDPGYGAEEAQAELRAAVEVVAPDVAVDQQVVCDLPARALLEAGAAADLLVVGARGLGGFKGLLLGSVSERVIEEAKCPVVVVRQEHAGAANQPLVVGIDGSETSTRALRWAAREAQSRNTALRVVHAWQLPALAVPGDRRLGDVAESGAQAVLDEALADPALAGQRVEPYLAYGGAANAVLEHAGDASLVVVGSRGRGLFGRILLGSTSRQLAHHAPCPTVVVPN